ncbi:MAG: glycosyltransferase family 2 protein [Acidobacteria bacterium]|nr:glycosyltransferase family 2 protein [Acidobacteriota bacterium]
MPPISATIITCNEERNIAEALESLSWVDEIIVVDSGSEDATLDICRRFTDKIYYRDWTGYVDQKNYAVEKACNDWILSLDADERVSPKLQDEIEALNRKGFRESGYRIPRATFFMGRWIKHGDWYPDYQLRLFDRRHGKWQGGRVHESVQTDGAAGMLRGEIQHFTYRNFSEYLKRLESYTTLAALDYRRKGRRASSWMLFGKPLAVFIRAYLLKCGFLDGTAGFTVAVMGAVSAFFKYAKLHELCRKDSGGIPPQKNKRRI